ncbi:hypothetical protein [Roseivirga spongicola]|uniref:Outer membrane protein beta-barrel domain-containing protein n=1 Tax=Roseivirga spongicola TaxID=333140 RepID=A0A150XB11_9BACT|nr:hypothetical protein [Roseivirga spongicola]KYG75862.1 hypothetical protein AWW68_08515 [Roseivirga spongicola]WPZ10567.1 hypothetical protein T7867_00470 [Roseivirga spongicola]
MQKATKSLYLFIIAIFMSSQVHLQAQFLPQTDIEISYNNVNAWSKLDDFQNNNNDGYGFGLALNHTLSNDVLINLKYSLNNIEYRDLERRYMNSYYELKTGYGFQLSEFTEIIPQMGFGVTNLNQYNSIQTQIAGQPESKSTTHYDKGEKEPFRNWIAGARLKHKLSNSIFIGLDMNIYYSFNFDIGRTIFSPYISISPFK